MKKLKTNKKIKLFIILFIFGIILGFIYINHFNKKELINISNCIKNNKCNLIITNNAINHIKLLSFVTLFSYIYIGVLFLFGTIISEGFIFVLRILIYYKIKHMKGLLYALIYYFLNNILYLILLFILFKKIINIVKQIYIYRKKKEISRLNIVLDNVIRSIFIILLIFGTDLLIYNFFPKILKLFAFLLK